MKPRLLDLFCGAGGAAMGYHRAGFDVVGVDIKPQPRYPFEFHQADALEFCAAHGREFDAIHASPPCQGYSSMRTMWNAKKHPLLIGDCESLFKIVGRPWVIENVEGAALPAGKLCGRMFGLPIYRHRFFATSFFWLCPPHPEHKGEVFSPGRLCGSRALSHCRSDVQEAGAAAFGVQWMKGNEISQAIPPAYTEFIGRQLMRLICVEDVTPAPMVPCVDPAKITPRVCG